jgi:hypothetical protein
LGIASVLLAASAAQAQLVYQAAGDQEAESLMINPNQGLFPAGVDVSWQHDPHTSIVESGSGQGSANVGVGGGGAGSINTVGYVSALLDGGATAQLTSDNSYGSASFTDTLSITLTNQSPSAVLLTATENVSSTESIYASFGPGTAKANGSSNISDSLGALSLTSSASLNWQDGQEASESASGQSIIFASNQESVQATSQSVIFFTLAPGETDDITMSVDGPASTQNGTFAPEPASLSLLAIAALPLLGLIRRRAIVRKRCAMIRRVAVSLILGSVTVFLVASMAHAQSGGDSSDHEIEELLITGVDSPTGLPAGVVYSWQDDPNTSIVESGGAVAGAFVQPSISTPNGNLDVILEGSASASAYGDNYYGAGSFSDTLSLTLTNQNSSAVLMVASESLGSEENVSQFGPGIGKSNGLSSTSDSLGAFSLTTSASLYWQDGQEVSESASGQYTSISSSEVIAGTTVNIIFFTLAPGETDDITMSVDGPASTQNGTFAPEPASLSLLAIAALPLLGLIRRRAIR